MDSKDKKVILFCGKGDCCPVITLREKDIIIEDDFGGKVKLTKEQFEVLKEKVIKQEI